MAAPFPATTVIDQGRDWFLTVIWNDSNGDPVNLAGYTSTFCIREDYDEPVLLTLTDGDGITIIAAAGQFDLHITHEQSNLPEGTYVAELIATLATVETSLLKGPIPIVNKVVP